MLVSLSVSDFALFSSATFVPEEGFVALTGQTGAGKSLVVDALAFVTGSRKGREYIRRGAERCSVHALFSPVDKVCRESLALLGVECEEDGIEFYRSLSSDSRSVCRINGRQCTLGVLRAAAGLFCDIHEQEDAHALLDTARHISYLDAFAPETFGAAMADFEKEYRAYTEAKAHFQSLKVLDKEEEKARRDFLEYQIKELESARIRDGEYESLLKTKERLCGSRQLAEAKALLANTLSGEDGAYDLVMRASVALSDLSSAAPEYRELSERLERAAQEIADVVHAAGAEERDDTDPIAQMDAVEERLRVLRRLFSLYAPTEAELVSLMEQKKRELAELKNVRTEARERHANALKARDAAANAAKELTTERVRAAKLLQTEILSALSDLDMPAVRFEVRIEAREKLSPLGLDDVEFYIGTNVGQEMMPLCKIASGGELSRILLALRLVLSRMDNIGTLVFDEIDTGVSGKSAAKIGAAMRKLGGVRQVLAVTHSAQVASAAHAQVRVEKRVVKGETVAEISALGTEERVQEIARILGGEEISQTSLAAAKELLAQGKQ